MPISSKRFTEANKDGHTVRKVAVATYDFAVHGGAIGDIVIGVDPDRPKVAEAVTIPNDAVIVDGFLEVLTQLTSGGAATIALKSEGAGDLLAATAVGSFTAGAKLDLIPNSGASGMLKMTADRKLTATIATATLTAGKFRVFVEYLVTE